MGQIVGDHVGRELLRLRRLEELHGAELWVITLGVSPATASSRRVAMG
jgi:hypothetical protein